MFYLILTVATLQRVKVQNNSVATAGPVPWLLIWSLTFTVCFLVSVYKFTQLYTEESEFSKAMYMNLSYQFHSKVTTIVILL